MGQIKSMKCSVCGNKWQQYIGSGFTVTYYYCDRCGRKLITGNNDYVDQCDCGGTFDKDVVMCPKCHNSAFEVDDKIVILWD